MRTLTILLAAAIALASAGSAMAGGGGSDGGFDGKTQTCTTDANGNTVCN